MQSTFGVRRLVVTAALGAVVLTGCQAPEQPAAHDPVPAQDHLTVGGVLASPGLLAGTDTTQVTGLEADVMTAVLARLPEDSEVSWKPVTYQSAVDALASQSVDFVIGQLDGPQLSAEVSWLGPYLSTQAGLLTHRASPEESELPADPVVSSLDAVAGATVCVVAGSLADVDGLEVGTRVDQRSVAECETGLRSGRYDAVAADTLQLAGVLTDPQRAQDYTLVSWSQLAQDADEEAEVPEALLQPREYWIGVSPQFCAAAADALVEVMADPEFDQLVATWGDSAGITPQQLAAPDPADCPA